MLRHPLKELRTFRRHPVPETHAEEELNYMKRIEKNRCRSNDANGWNALPMRSYFEYWTKAAELGDADAHYKLAGLYNNGEGVEKDDKKCSYHWEEAASGGHAVATHTLASIEMENVRYERAVKHYIIATNLGEEDAMTALWEFYAEGGVKKDQAAVDAAKSPQRKAAEEANRRAGIL